MPFDIGNVITKNIHKANPVQILSDAKAAEKLAGFGKTISQLPQQKPVKSAAAAAAAAIDRTAALGNINTDDPTTFAGSVGDWAFPDNPKMRERAEQLEDDCREFERQFIKAKQKFEQLEKQARASMFRFLQKKGFASLDDLDAEVRRVATGTALAEWDALRKRIGRTMAVENMIETICGLATLGGITVTAALFTIGVISGPAGWAALGAIGTATAILGAIVFVGAIIAAADQDKRLRVCIRDLHKARAELKLNLNRVNLLADWVDAFSTYLDMTEDIEFRGFNFLFKQLDKSDKWRWEPSEVTKNLTEFDTMRGAWTGADP